MSELSVSDHLEGILSDFEGTLAVMVDGSTGALSRGCQPPNDAQHAPSVRAEQRGRSVRNQCAASDRGWLIPELIHTNQWREFASLLASSTRGGGSLICTRHPGTRS